MTKLTRWRKNCITETCSFLPQQTYLIFKSKKRKKTITIAIKPDSSIHVMAPFHLKQKIIFNFINSKKEWLKKKIGQLQNKQALSKTKRFSKGELFPYLGKHYALSINQGCFSILNGSSIAIDNQDQNKIKRLFIKWYKKEALRFIKEKTDLYSKHMALFPQDIKITSARRRWGSCTHTNTLNFPWRIICLPPYIINYIVVHELAHISQKNHSKNFWKIVSTVLPDYKLHRKWLKEKAADFEISFHDNEA